MAFTLLIVGCAAPTPLSVRTTGDVERGERVFAQVNGGVPPCSTCHHVTSGQTGFSIGPNLAGIGERAKTRIEGLSAEEYLYQSIVQPKRYIVSGYRAIMYSEYETHLSEQDILDLVAYLLSL